MKGWEINIIRSGEFWLDGGAMHGIVPFNLWINHHKPDPLGRIKLNTNLLLLRRGEKIVLVNGGIGNFYTEKERSIYNPIAEELPALLNRYGVHYESVTDIIVTHLHFDHIGGLVNKDGEFLFPNAIIHVQKRHWKWAQSPSLKDKGSFKPILWSSWKKINFIEGDTELFDKLKLKVFNGHTLGMQLPLIIGVDGNCYLFLSDLVPTVSHINPVWNMAYDNYPLITIKEKIKVWEEGINNNWIFILEHDPMFNMIKIFKNNENKYKFEPCDNINL